MLEHRYSYRIDLYSIPESVKSNNDQQWCKVINYSSIIGWKMDR